MRYFSLFRTFYVNLVAAFFASVWLTQPAFSLEVAGVIVEERARVGGSELVLNGAGVRHALGGLVRVYVGALYLPQKRSTSLEIAAIRGSKRLQMTFLREISTEDFSKGFLSGVRENLTPATRIEMLDAINQLGIAFGKTHVLRKGDVILMDHIPGKGMVITIRGRQVGEPIANEKFWDAVFQIWVGSKPVDASLKAVLLGQRESNEYSRQSLNPSDR
jgi:hypothetical protein